MKKIAILLPTLFPVPAVMGGAIETLIEGLIRQNEKTPIFQFTVFSAYNAKAAEISKEFKYTKFVYVKSSLKLYRYYYFLYRLVKKVFKIALPDNLARKKMIDALNCDEYDWILFEAGEVFSLLNYRNKLDAEKVLVHAHGMITPIPKTDSCFSYFISISDFVSNYWSTESSRPLETYKVWHNCIEIDNFNKKTDTETIEKMRTELGIEKNDFVLIFTGRIIPEKGVLELLQAVRLLNSKSVKVIIIGSANFAETTATPYEAEVKAQKELLGNKVIFTGYVHNTELYKYYQLADIAVVPSMWDEPAGLVVIEALAAGKPVITTGSGGMKEYLIDDVAIKVDRNSDTPQELAKAIAELMADEEKRHIMSKKALEHAKKYDMSNYLRRLQEIITEISCD